MASEQAITRGVYGVFIFLASAFIVASIVQIARAVFQDDARIHAVASEACAATLRAEAGAIDRALAAAAAASDAREGERMYFETLSADPLLEDRGRRACASDAAGADALAALARLHRAAESSVRRQSAALGPVRREVYSFIR